MSKVKSNIDNILEKSDTGLLYNTAGEAVGYNGKVFVDEKTGKIKPPGKNSSEKVLNSFQKFLDSRNNNKNKTKLKIKKK